MHTGSLLRTELVGVDTVRFKAEVQFNTQVWSLSALAIAMEVGELLNRMNKMNRMNRDVLLICSDLISPDHLLHACCLPMHMLALSCTEAWAHVAFSTWAPCAFWEENVAFEKLFFRHEQSQSSWA